MKLGTTEYGSEKSPGSEGRFLGIPPLEFAVKRPARNYRLLGMSPQIHVVNCH